MSIVMKRQQTGFTLIELMVSLTIMAAVATVLIQSTAGLQDQSRYDQTVARVQQIKNAILNLQTNNGVTGVSGFVADMGRLPNNIHELLESQYCKGDIGINPVTYPANYAATCNTVTGGTWTNLGAWGALAPICSDGNPLNVATNTCLCTDGSTPTGPPYVCALPATLRTAVTLNGGWRGPYIQTTQDPSETKTSNNDPVNNSILGADAFTDGWGKNIWPDQYDSQYVSSTVTPAWLDLNNNDVRHNYGWAYLANHGGNSAVSLYSYGKNGCLDNNVLNPTGCIPSSVYDPEYPTPASQPPYQFLIPALNWQVDLLNGVNVTITTNSSCSFPNPSTTCAGLPGTWSSTATLPTTQAACEAAGGSWSGTTCSVTGTNTCSLIPNSSAWYPANQTACQAASGTWTSPTTCTLPAFTIPSQDFCALLGGSIDSSGACYGVPPTQTASACNTSFGGTFQPVMPICLNIYYISNDVLTITSLNGSVPEDGLAHTVKFVAAASTPIPVGNAAISIHGGSCTNSPAPGTTTSLYPSTRTSAVPVNIVPSQVPSFVW